MATNGAVPASHSTSCGPDSLIWQQWFTMASSCRVVGRNSQCRIDASLSAENDALRVDLRLDDRLRRPIDIVAIGPVGLAVHRHIRRAGRLDRIEPLTL